MEKWQFIKSIRTAKTLIVSGRNLFQIKTIVHDHHHHSSSYFVTHRHNEKFRSVLFVPVCIHTCYIRKPNSIRTKTKTIVFVFTFWISILLLVNQFEWNTLHAIESLKVNYVHIDWSKKEVFISVFLMFVCNSTISLSSSSGRYIFLLISYTGNKEKWTEKIESNWCACS